MDADNRNVDNDVVALSRRKLRDENAPVRRHAIEREGIPPGPEARARSLLRPSVCQQSPRTQRATLAATHQIQVPQPPLLAPLATHTTSAIPPTRTSSRTLRRCRRSPSCSTYALPNKLAAYQLPTRNRGIPLRRKSAAKGSCAPGSPPARGRNPLSVVKALRREAAEGGLGVHVPLAEHLDASYADGLAVVGPLNPGHVVRVAIVLAVCKDK